MKRVGGHHCCARVSVKPLHTLTVLSEGEIASLLPPGPIARLWPIVRGAICVDACRSCIAGADLAKFVSLHGAKGGCSALMFFSYLGRQITSVRSIVARLLCYHKQMQLEFVQHCC